MIVLTGDLHGDHDIHRLASKRFPLGNTLTREDYLIVCGDFGLVWDDSPAEHYWRQWLEAKPWTTLWIDGNHENFDLLADFPLEEWHGGVVQRISEHVLHLCRGYVFELEGKRFFAFGGAESHDRQYRKYGKSIWLDEMPSTFEMERGRAALDAVDWQVDYVLTHTMPASIQAEHFAGLHYGENALTAYFEALDQRLQFQLWCSGHYHISHLYDARHAFLYDTIIRLLADGHGFERVYPRHTQDLHAPCLPVLHLLQSVAACPI